MKQTYNEFNTIAQELAHTNTVAGEVKEARTSLSNELAWVAFAISLNGTAEDKATLKESIAKDAPHHKLRGMVSKANAVAFYLLTHDAIEMEESTITLDAINEVPADAIPSVTINELYKVVNDASKQDIDGLNRKKAIEKQAIKQAETFFNRDINAKAFALLPSVKQQEFIAEATLVVDAMEAEKAKGKAQETRAEAIARLVAEIVKLDATNEVMEALTSPVAQVA